MNTAQINHSSHFSIHFTLVYIHWTCQLSQLIRAFTNTESPSKDIFLLSVSLHKPLYFVFPYIFLFSVLFFSLTPLSSPRLHFLLSIFLVPPNLSRNGRFKSLVDSEEGIESFRALYRIPPGVGIRYCKERQWHKDKQDGEVIIPMIAFIEEGMTIPMGTITRDYLRAHRLAPTQCAPNMFRILGCVDALNKRIGLNLTHHDVN